MFIIGNLRTLQKVEIRRFGVLMVCFLLMTQSILGQGTIDDLSIDFLPSDVGQVRVLTGPGDCDSNPGIFGISDGAFVINDMEGATCCPTSPLQGLNDNIALIGPFVATASYCEVSIIIDISLSSTDFESCLSRSLDPIGCTAFIPTFDPGGDGFQIEGSHNGVPFVTGGYCGQARRGNFTATLEDINIGDDLSFLVTGGTQDEDEIYRIESIVVMGRAKSLVPATIDAAQTILCEGIDPLILTEISGGNSYQWEQDGMPLGSSTFSYNSSGAATLADAGLYSVTVTDAGGCTSTDSIRIEVLAAVDKLLTPTFTGLQLNFCETDTLILPLMSDEGVTGTWNLASPFPFLNQLDSSRIIFEPDNPQYISVTFELNIEEKGTFLSGRVIQFCEFQDQLLYDPINGWQVDPDLFEFSITIDTALNTANHLLESVNVARLPYVLQDMGFGLGGDTTNLFLPRALSEVYYVTMAGKSRSAIYCTENYIEESLTIRYDYKRVSIDTTLCFGQELMVYGVPYDQDTIIEALIGGAANGCDSIITLALSIRDDISVTRIDTTCAGGSVELENIVFDSDNPSGVVNIIGQNGACDTTVNFQLIFEEKQVFEVTDIICPRDTIFLGEEKYHYGRLTGQLELVGSVGCISIFNVALEQGLIEMPINFNPCDGDLQFRGLDVRSDTTILVFGDLGHCDTSFVVSYAPGNVADSILTPTICQEGQIEIEGVMYDRLNATGSFSITTSLGCQQTVQVVLDILPTPVDSMFQVELCQGDSLLLEGTMYHVNNTQGSFLTLNGAGCEQVVQVEAIINESILTYLRDTICPNDQIIIDGQTFDTENLNGEFSYPANEQRSCDSTLIVELVEREVLVRQLDLTICEGDTIEIQGIRFYEGVDLSDVFFVGANICDTALLVQLEIFRPQVESIAMSICDGDSIIIGGETFNASRTSGIINLQTDAGCDSIINVDIEILESSNINFSRTLCLDTELNINGTIYNANNRTGVESMTASNGCDSIVAINLSFTETITTTIDSTLCQGEGIQVGANFYNAALAMGTEMLTSANGCDSIVNVTLNFTAIDIVLDSKPTCLQSSNGSISIAINTPGTYDVLVGGRSYEVGDSTLVINQLNARDYSIQVIAEDGCEYDYSVMVENLFDLSVTVTKEPLGPDLIQIVVTPDGPIDNIVWEISDDLSCIDCLNPTVPKNGSGVYRAVVLDPNGCIDAIEVILDDIIPTTFYVSNVIHPNGIPDNRYFFLQTNNDEIVSYNLRIYNRWGSALFANANLIPNTQQDGWNGTMSNQSVGSGIYVYTMEIQKSDGTIEIVNGELLVLQ